MPMIPARGLLLLIHPLLDHCPGAVVRKEKCVMINLKPVLHQGRVNFCRHARIVDEVCGERLGESEPPAPARNLIRRFARCLPLAPADENAEIALRAADRLFQCRSQNRGKPGRIPVKSKHGAERLKPHRIGNPAHKFIRPVFFNQDPGHLPSEPHHALKQPPRAGAVVQRKCGNAAMHALIVLRIVYLCKKKNDKTQASHSVTNRARSPRRSTVL